MMFNPGQWIPYSRLKDVYVASPLWLQRLVSMTPLSIRCGKVFRTVRQLIEESDFASAEEIADRQGTLLCKLVEHAFHNVPFYRSYMENNRLRPGDIRTVDDLRRLPLVSREMMRSQQECFWAIGGIGESWYWDNTGGSTGTPFRFRKANSMYAIEQAFMLAQWRRIGYRPNDRKITLRGQVIGDSNGRPKWQYNPIYNELQLSSFHLDAENVADYLAEMSRFQPRFIHGYPSAIMLFLKVLADNGMQLPKGIRGVLCCSEPLFDYQRQAISDALGCRVYSWYGQSECVVLAGECEVSQSYHAFPLYGVLEIVDGDGNSISSPGVEGEIVGTSLHNKAMPFLRYRTGDRGAYDQFEKCKCGRCHPRLTRVLGRSQDYVYTRKNTAIPVTALVFGQHFVAFAHIHGMQLFQDTLGRLVIRVVRGNDYTEKDEQELCAKMNRAVDGEIECLCEYCESLPVTVAGKTPFVVNEIGRNGGGVGEGVTKDRGSLGE